ncbi:polysaccharide pyruvyl transferase family protein [Mesorhizobium xinjiangense]|uniref:polysaccharide pyruvyl transferase family protein n=1 Tax=Mesorhizobium xinjiangense TaxID=2678685 RepID=UPI0012EE1EBE|nr:polysaccharide pyruvyl transferase family protein [Mesorhizobium xinjiangense]
MNARHEIASPRIEPGLDGSAAQTSWYSTNKRWGLRRRRPQKIALFGLFGCGNLGNDGSLEAMLDFLRRERPEAEIVCICDQPEVVADGFALDTRPISLSRHLTGFARKLDRLMLRIPGKICDVALSFRHLRNVDAMVVPGTGILDDFGERPHGMPLDIFTWFLTARLLGVKTGMVSIGAGPIRHPLSRRLMMGAARLAHYRSYRDAISKEFMEKLGFDTSRDRVYPDIAFNLDSPSAHSRAKAPDEPLTVGVGVMSYYGWYGFEAGGPDIFAGYLKKITRFIVHLLDEGHDVRLLTGEDGDWTAVDAVRDAVDKARPDMADGRVVADPCGSLNELMEQIVRTDIVVATRFHNIVCALKTGKPAISLGYALKNDVLMAEMGMGDYCHHVEQFDVDELIAQFARIVARRGEHEKTIAESNRAFRQALERQDAELLARLV